MRIISQDRTISYNFDKINIFREGLSLVAMNESVDKKVLLGIYQTEERAAEVFGDIHNACVTTYENTVYYMPEV